MVPPISSIHRAAVRPCAVVAAFAIGCEPAGKTTGDSGTTGTTDTSDTADDTGDTGDTPPVDGCRATPRDADADRVVLVNLPFDGSGQDWAAFQLGADGSLTDTGATLTAGEAYLNPGVFTPDGSLGVVALEDGTISVFSVDDAGTVAVVDAGWTSGFYAVGLGMDPTGERVWIADQNWVDNGGGLYAIDLDCETGLPSVAADLPVDPAGRLVPAKLPAAALPVPGRPDRLVLVGGENGLDDVTLVDTTTGTVLDAVDAFDDPEDAFLGTGAITPDGSLVLLTDTSSWSEREQEVAAVALDGDTLRPAGVDDLFDGVGLAVDPGGSTALASSGFADELIRLALHPDQPDAVTVAGTLSTDGGPPQLPGGMVVVQRGALAGLVLVSEVYGLRSVMLGEDGAATDLGVTGGRLSNPGSMLIQP